MSALRAKKPEAVTKRLKLFMFGPAGVGKTTAAIQFPNSYIIDCEKGTPGIVGVPFHINVLPNYLAPGAWDVPRSAGNGRNEERTDLLRRIRSSRRRG